MTKRSWLVLIAIDVVLLAISLALILPTGNVAAAGLVVITFVVVPAALFMTNRSIERANRKRSAALEKSHPGSTFLPCVTGPTQEPLLKAAGERTTNGVAATLVYGPRGISVWSGKSAETKVFAYPWSRIAGVTSAADVRTWQKRTTTGLRITLTDGEPQDVAVTVPKPKVPALAESIWAARPV